MVSTTRNKWKYNLMDWKHPSKSKLSFSKGRIKLLKALIDALTELLSAVFKKQSW